MNVSVVIPAHKESDFDIQVAVESAPTGRDDEVVLVRDGRDLYPKSRLISDGVSFYHKYHDGFREISTIHAGVCHARNLGIFHAQNDLIVPLDADDEMLPDGVKHLVEAWQPGTFVYGNWLEGPYLGPDDAYDPGKLVNAPPPEMLHHKHVAHATWLFHKDDWARVGGYDPDFNIGGEDWAFMCALVEAGVRPIRINAPIYRRTVRAGSRTDQARGRIDFIKQLLREKYPTVMNAG